jgi:hypothetical protein
VTNAASANNALLVSRERSANAIGSALSLFVGRGRRYSVKQLSNATGVKDRMIECAKLDPGNPDWRPLPSEALLSIAGFLGADFTNEWLPLAGQGAFDLPDETPNPGDLAADNSDDNARLVRIAIDNSVDRDEAPDAAAIGSRMMTRGAQLVAIGGRP